MLFFKNNTHRVRKARRPLQVKSYILRRKIIRWLNRSRIAKNRVNKIKFQNPLSRTLSSLSAFSKKAFKQVKDWSARVFRVGYVRSSEIVESLKGTFNRILDIVAGQIPSINPMITVLKEVVSIFISKIASSLQEWVKSAQQFLAKFTSVIFLSILVICSYMFTGSIKLHLILTTLSSVYLFVVGGSIHATTFATITSLMALLTRTNQVNVNITNQFPSFQCEDTYYDCYSTQEEAYARFQAELPPTSDMKSWLTKTTAVVGMIMLASKGIKFDFSNDSIQQLMSRHIALQKAYSSWEWMLKNIGDWLFTSYQLVAKYLFGMDIIDPNHVEEVEELYKEVINMISLNNQRALTYSFDEAMKVENFYRKYMVFRRKYADNKKIVELLSTILPMISALYKRVVDKNPLSAQFRKEPVCVSIKGEPGVGKSYILQVMKRDLAAILGKEEDHEKITMYMRCAEQEFWDGYAGQQICCFDDIGQRVDSIANPNLEFFELIRAVNIFPYMLHSAALHEKANNVFVSDFVVLTTNLKEFQVNSIISSEALRRRIHLDVVMEVIEEVRKDDSAQLDLEKLHNYRQIHNLPNTDLSHVRFIQTCGPMKRILNYDQFIKVIEQQHQKHVQDFANREEYANANLPWSVRRNQVEVPSFQAENELVCTGRKVRYEQINIALQHDVPNFELFRNGYFVRANDFYKFNMRQRAHISAALPVGLPITEPNENGQITYLRINHILHNAPDYVGRPEYEEFRNEWLERLGRNGQAVFDDSEPESDGEIDFYNQFADAYYEHDINRIANIHHRELRRRRRELGRDLTTDEEHQFMADTTYRLQRGELTDRSSQEEGTNFQVLRPDVTPETLVEDPEIAYAQLAISEIDRDYRFMFSQIGERVRSTFSGTIDDIVDRAKFAFRFIKAVITATPGWMIAAIFLSISVQVVWLITFIRTCKSIWNGNIFEGTRSKQESHYKKRRSFEGTRSKQENRAQRRQKFEGLNSQLGFNIANMIRKNQYVLYLIDEQEQTEVKIGTILMVKGHFGLINQHYLNKIEHFKQGCPLLEYRKPGNISGIEQDYGEFLESIVKIDRKRGESDLAWFRAPSAMPLKSDITKHFATIDDLNQLGRGTKVILPTIQEDECVMRTGTIIGLDVKTSVEDIYTDKFVRFLDVISYDMDTIGGDCGSPLIAQTDLIQRRMLGIHFAGGNGMGMCQPITKEVLQSIPLESEPESESHIQWQDGAALQKLGLNCNLEYVGHINQMITTSLKTKIEPSILHECFPVQTAPAVLEHPFSIDGPMLKGIKKYGGNTKLIDQNILREAVASYSQVLFDRTLPAIEYEKKKLSIEDAIRGIPGSEYVNGIKRSKSAGYPWMYLTKKPGKTEWLGDGDDFKLSGPKYKELRKAVVDLDQKLENGIVPEVIFVDTLKDERRTLDKVEAKKTRAFAAAPVDFTILQRQYFLGFLSFMARNKIYNECAVGTNAHSDDWAKIARFLRFPSDETMIAGDFSNFDGTLNFYILEAICDVINNFYGDGENKKKRKLLWRSITNCKHVIGNIVYQLSHSQPSGNAATAVINSMYNSIAVRYCYGLIFGEVKSFNENVRMIAYGDDNIISVSPVAQELFNPLTISTAFKEFGMTYTSEDKQEQTATFRKLTDVTFLKRGFVYDEHLNYWFAPLSLVSIQEMVMWIHKTPQPIEACKENIKMAAFELYHHDRREFDRIVDAIQSRLSNMGESVNIVPYTDGRKQLVLGKLEQLYDQFLVFL